MQGKDPIHFFQVDFIRYFLGHLTFILMKPLDTIHILRMYVFSFKVGITVILHL